MPGTTERANRYTLHAATFPPPRFLGCGHPLRWENDQYRASFVVLFCFHIYLLRFHDAQTNNEGTFPS